MLSADEFEAVVRTRLPLLLYASRRLGLDEGATSVGRLLELPSRHRFDVSVALCGRPEIIGDYLREDPDRLSAEDRDLVDGYRHALHGDFVLVRHLSRYTVIVGGDDPPVAYGVCALPGELEDEFPDPPYMVAMVLLPVRGRITFDGVIIRSPAYFGAGARRGFEQELREAKARFGIVTALPFSRQERPGTDEARLRALTRSWRGVRENWDVIRDIAFKNDALLVLYHQRLGELAARDHRKRLREAGVEEGWFATLDSTFIAGGRTRKDVSETVNALVPGRSRELVHFYTIKGK